MAVVALAVGGHPGRPCSAARGSGETGVGRERAREEREVTWVAKQPPQQRGRGERKQGPRGPSLLSPSPEAKVDLRGKKCR